MSAERNPSISLTTPLMSSEHVRKAARKFGLSPLQKVQRQPRGTLGACYQNSLAAADKRGGSVVLGWQILLARKLFVMALHHAVWRRPDGHLIDVTPAHTGDGKPYSLFALDDSEVDFSEGNPPSKYLLLTPTAAAIVSHADARHRERNRRNSILYRSGWVGWANRLSGKRGVS